MGHRSGRVPLWDVGESIMEVALGPRGPDAEAGAHCCPWGAIGGGRKAALGAMSLLWRRLAGCDPGETGYSQRL